MPDPEAPTIQEPAVQSLPDQIVESVGIANVKTVGESASFFTALAFGNAVSAQQNANTLAHAALASGMTIMQAATGKVAELIVSTDLPESVGLGALASTGAKQAGNVPPVTP